MRRTGRPEDPVGPVVAADGGAGAGGRSAALPGPGRIRAAVVGASRSALEPALAEGPAESCRRIIRGIDVALSLLEDALAAGADSAVIRRGVVGLAESTTGIVAPRVALRARSSAELHDALLDWQGDYLWELACLLPTLETAARGLGRLEPAVPARHPALADRPMPAARELGPSTRSVPSASIVEPIDGIRRPRRPGDRPPRRHSAA